MTKNEFIQRFQLSHFPVNKQYQQHVATCKLRQSAVLIAMVEIKKQLHVLLTKRATHLKHHAGQISFPGGKVEPFDKTLYDTALREAYEETGLQADECEVIGQLAPHKTNSGFIITPVIAIVSHMPNYIMDKNEVSEIFHVPLQHFLASENSITLSLSVKAETQNIHFMPYKSYNIWGATAAILNELQQHLLQK